MRHTKKQGNINSRLARYEIFRCFIESSRFLRIWLVDIFFEKDEWNEDAQENTVQGHNVWPRSSR